jgi:hypothetical protein
MIELYTLLVVHKPNARYDFLSVFCVKLGFHFLLAFFAQSFVPIMHPYI